MSSANYSSLEAQLFYLWMCPILILAYVIIGNMWGGGIYAMPGLCHLFNIEHYFQPEHQFNH